MADVGEVGPDLMGPAGEQLDLDVGDPAPVAERAQVALRAPDRAGSGERVEVAIDLAILVGGRQLGGVATPILVVAYVPGDQVLLGAQAPDRERAVALVDAAIAEHVTERAVGHVVLGTDDEAAGVAIQSVHDTRPLDAADGETRDTEEERVDEGAIGVAGGRVHDHARRLVDDEDRVVFEDDVEGQVLGHDTRRRGRRLANLDALTRPHLRRRFARRAVDEHPALGDPLAPARAGVMRQPGRHKDVEAGGPRLVIDLEHVDRARGAVCLVARHHRPFGPAHRMVALTRCSTSRGPWSAR